MADVVFRVDADAVSPAVGDEWTFLGCGVIEAGDVVALGKERGIGRVEVVAEEHWRGIQRLAGDLCERLGTNRIGWD